MSAALNQRSDSSFQSHSNSHSILPQPDLSLGSLISTPAKSIRVPSSASRDGPLSTPSPPYFRRNADDARSTPVARRLGLSGHDEEDGDLGDDVLNTAQKDRKWDDAGEGSSTAAGRRKRSSANGKGVHLTLRDQEKHIDNLKKENFSIKLKVHFLEERLAQLAPDQIDAALKQNINLKIEVQQRGMDTGGQRRRRSRAENDASAKLH
ncbi:hypothetical protein EWM64_g832 [Hericium alpestre]|uniref:Centrosomin N-terminal motif 1 domain-containing protein n=1 Tax=Hericium alpestre TaxID=135208 RepID=A0A4Z0AC23_9AGAM|nr:hypothetical protein EWM64_g832 [Hericium alpestre]